MADITIHMGDPFDLSEVRDLLRQHAGRWRLEVAQGLPILRVRLSDGRCIDAMHTLFGGRIGITTADYDDGGYDDVWCYPSFPAACRAALQWDGQGEPVGWHWHPATGRYQSPSSKWSRKDRRHEQT